jgi:hypothetical protein
MFLEVGIWFFGQIFCCLDHSIDQVKVTYNINIYFKVVEVQIQASERILKLGRDPSHPGAVLKAHTRKIREK